MHSGHGVIPGRRLGFAAVANAVANGLTTEISPRLQALTFLYERGGKAAELTPQGGASLSRAFEA